MQNSGKLVNALEQQTVVEFVGRSVNNGIRVVSNKFFTRFSFRFFFFLHNDTRFAYRIQMFKFTI